MTRSGPAVTAEGWSLGIDGLEDPFTGRSLGEVRIEAGLLRHVGERHADQPLDEVFGRGNLRRLGRRPGREVYEECGHRLAKELRAGLEAGLVLGYDARGACGRLATTYLVVLPSGAVAVLRLGNQASVRSVYFVNRSVRRRSAEQRRAAAAGGLVNRYAVRSEQVGAYVQPATGHARRVVNTDTGRVQVRTNIRFCRPERWGFRLDLEGHPYRGRVDVSLAA